MKSSNILEMTFTPNTIEHLGVRMYSTLPPVLAELIANSYDANAQNVKINLNDKTEKEITISDNGHGMSFDEINTKFLRIGRNRRSEDEQEYTRNKMRKAIGKKGLGKLSFFGIAHTIVIQTIADGVKNSFVMEWQKILGGDAKDRSSQSAYNPKIIVLNEKTDKADGTKVILRNIQRATDFNSDSLADSISKYFILDPDFVLEIYHNDKPKIIIDNERKYSKLTKQFEWEIPKDISLDKEYKHHNDISGHLIATEKPIAPSTNMKGITLFSRKKLVNLPEYFSDSTSSHFFTYLTGWLEVDFIDDLGEDVISTNRQSLNWEHEEMVELRSYLQKLLRELEIEWREKRKQKRRDSVSKATSINIPQWQSTLPPEINKSLDVLLMKVIEESELESESTSQSIQELHKIIPEYPNFHWRSLHPTLHNLVKKYYINQDYYTAVLQGVLKYQDVVKSRAGSSFMGKVLFENTFSIASPKLSVTAGYLKLDGSAFDKQTLRNIEEGHRGLAIAIWQAFRCPLTHEVVQELRNSDLYSEKDCLDALSLLSHLFRRLDNATIVTSKTKPQSP